MTDYNALVRMLTGGGLLGNALIQPVAQRFPQNQQGLLPNNLSEGARPYGGGRAGYTPPEIPPRINEAWTAYTRKQITAKELQSVVKSHGWQMDLRSPVNEIFPPTGKAIPLD